MTDSAQLEQRFLAWDAIMTAGAFEAAHAALEESVQLLESGGLTLDEMTHCYEAGIRLSRRCTDLLRHAELQIAMLEDSIAEEEESAATPTDTPDDGPFD